MAQRESTSDAQSTTSAAAFTGKQLSRRFVMLVSVTCAAVVLIGWTTGIRDLMHTSLITFCVFALFPFVVLCVVLAAFMLLAFVLGLIGASTGTDDVLLFAVDGLAMDSISGVSKGIPIYYRWLARHRASPWLGLPLGILLGGLLLWAALAAFVVPREASTIARLQAAQILIEDHYERLGRYPQPDERSSFLVLDSAAAAFTDARSADGQLLDAFAQPVDYVVTGRGRLSAYRLRSVGFDGARSSDDLCASGRTRLLAVVDFAVAVRDLASILRPETRSWRAKFEDIYAASCDR
jgi:hypothetical protein